MITSEQLRHLQRYLAVIAGEMDEDNLHVRSIKSAIATIEALPETKDGDEHGEHNEIMDAIDVFRAQWREAKGDGPEITCPCGTKAPVRFLFRCLYCGVWLCQSCAEVHFGKKRSEVVASPAMATPWESSTKNAELAARDGQGG